MSKTAKGLDQDRPARWESIFSGPYSQYWVFSLRRERHLAWIAILGYLSTKEWRREMVPVISYEKKPPIGATTNTLGPLLDCLFPATWQLGHSDKPRRALSAFVLLDFHVTRQKSCLLASLSSFIARLVAVQRRVFLSLYYALHPDLDAKAHRLYKYDFE